MEITLTVPEYLKDFVEAEVAAGGHGTATNYLQSMLLDAAKRKARERLEALLDEGLDSDDLDWTPGRLAELKREVSEYYSQQAKDRP